MRLRLFSLILVLSITLSAPNSFGLQIAREGKPTTIITIAPNASAAVQFAASELQHYIEAISGARLEIVRGAAPGTTAIRIECNTGPNVDLKEDGFIINSNGSGVTLAARSDRGAIYAAYAFLEDLGCRWIVPGDIGQIVPKRPTIDIPSFKRIENPDFEVRAFFAGRSPESEMWALRNRMNGFFRVEFARQHGNLLHFQPPLQHIHSFYTLIPVEKYFDAHPEYFPLIGGKRVKISQSGGQLCTTNPDVIRLVAEQVRHYFQANPDARIFTIAPNDGTGWCECPACKALDIKLCKGKIWSARRNNLPATTDRLMVFSHAVAEQALKDLPGRELYTFAYINYVEPPTTAPSDPRVVHWVCHYQPACYNHAIQDPQCPDNVEFDKSLRGWAQVEPWMGFYAYTDKSMWLGLPRPVTPQMAADIKYLHSLGVRKYVAQSNAKGWRQMGGLYFVTARLLWKVNQPLETILADYYENFFGPAGHAMRRFDEAVWKVAQESGAHYSDNPISQAPDVFDVDKLARAADFLQEALKTNADEAQRKRVEEIKANFDYGVEFIRMLKDIEAYEQTGEPEKLKAAATTASKYVKRAAGHPSVQRLLESIIAEAKGTHAVFWEGFGKPEQKGGRECRNSDETGPGDGAAGWATFRAFLPPPSAPSKSLTSHKAYEITMLVWGESSAFSLMVCSKGRGKGTAAGGVWTTLPRQGELSGKPEWCTLKFRVSTELLDPETRRQTFGFGGGDSQVWVAEITIKPVP